MKRSVYFFIPALLLITGLLAGFSGSDTDYPGGAPAGYTGSPGDGQNCTSCHNGSASNVSGWITSDIPSSGYVAGSTYTVTVTVTGSGQKGFEVSPQNASGTQLGTLIAGSGNHLTGGTKYVTHNTDIGSSPAVWSFQWTAPAAGAGNVTFYGAFCVGKPNTKLSTLAVTENVQAPLTVIAAATPNHIVNGDSVLLQAVPAGGSGSYTFAWTSSPAGFTSTLQSVYAKPTVSTIYTVTVNDGANTSSDTVHVTVDPAIGIFENTISSGIKITPNPSSGRFSLQSDGFDLNGANLFVCDLNGKVIYQSALSGPASTIDLGPAEKGIYLIKVNNREKTAASRLIIL